MRRRAAAPLPAALPLLALLATLLAAVLVGLLGAPAAAAAGAPALPAADGGDVSWPQCPKTPGGKGHGLPLPGAGAGFVVVGLTAGLPFHENPCLDAELAHVASTGARLAAYTFAAMPTGQEVRAHGGTGPYDATTRAGQLANTGYAQGQWSAAQLSARGVDVPLVWVDVEHRKAQDWTSNTTENLAVLMGAVKALQDSGHGVGFYSYRYGWDEITGGLRSPLPVWATAGRRGRTAALAMCAEPSFSGGPVLVAQWYDDVRDSDLACPAAGAPGTVRSSELAPYRGLVLRRGSHGEAVAALRGRLGVPVAPAFTRATALAVRAFQARHGLHPDGVVGPLTWRALGAWDVQRPSRSGLSSRWFGSAAVHR